MQPRQPQVRSYGLGGMGGGNAYARPFRSYGSPVEAPPPPVDEMRYVSGPTPIQQRVMPDTPPMARPAVMPRREYPVGPTPGMPYPEEPRVGSAIGQRLTSLPANFFDPPSQREYSRQAPVEATQGVVPEPNYSGGLGSLFGGIGQSTYSNQQRMPAPQEPYAGMYTGAAAKMTDWIPNPRQDPALAQQLERQRAAGAANDAMLNEVLPNGLTRRQQKAGWKVLPDGTVIPAGI